MARKYDNVGSGDMSYGGSADKPTGGKFDKVGKGGEMEMVPAPECGPDYTGSSDSHPLSSGWWTSHDEDMGSKTPNHSG